jgi:glycosyltransferase involved in cell wall biosynthesis
MFNIFKKLFGGILEKPLKVGLITYNYPLNKAVIAGPSVNTRNIARHLAELGCEVHVFTSGEKDKVIKRPIGKGKLFIHVLSVFIGVDIKKKEILERLKWYTFETRVLNSIMYENSKRWFDVVHTQGWPSTGFMLKHFSNMVWVHTFRSLSKKRFNIQRTETKFVPIHDWVEKTVVDADRVTAVSNRFRDEVIREIKGINKKTITIYNGIKLSLFQPSKNSHPAVLFIGRFCKAKGIEMMPEIIEKVLKKIKNTNFIWSLQKILGLLSLSIQNINFLV